MFVCDLFVCVGAWLAWVRLELVASFGSTGPSPLLGHLVLFWATSEIWARARRAPRPSQLFLTPAKSRPARLAGPGGAAGQLRAAGAALFPGFVVEAAKTKKEKARKESQYQRTEYSKVCSVPCVFHPTSKKCLPPHDPT